MTSPVATFEIRVLSQASGESWTDEAVVIIDGQDHLAGLSDNRHTVWMGRHPSDVLGPASPLLPTETPHDAFVARCACGIEGCNALIARIERVGDRVVWDELRRGSDARADEFPIDSEPFQFDAKQYERAVLDPGPPVTTWTPVTRRAAQLVTQRVGEGTGLEAEHGLRFAGCESQGDNHLKVQALLGRASDDDRWWVTVTFTLAVEETAADLAARVMAYLTSGQMVDDPAATRHRIAPVDDGS